jgi:hypothetical protein
LERLQISTYVVDVFWQQRWAYKDEVKPETDVPDAAGADELLRQSATAKALHFS